MYVVKVGRYYVIDWEDNHGVIGDVTLSNERMIAMKYGLARVLSIHLGGELIRIDESKEASDE